MTKSKLYVHIPRNESAYLECPECGSRAIYRETCMDCGLVIDKYFVNYDYGKGDNVSESLEHATHTLKPEYLKGSVIAYGEAMRKTTGRLHGVFRRLVKIQRQSIWWDNVYLNRIGSEMTDYMRRVGLNQNIQNLVNAEWHKSVAKLKRTNEKNIFINHLAITVIYTVVKRFNPIFRMDTIIEHFCNEADSSISRSDIMRIISDLKIPFTRPKQNDYIEFGIEVVAPMYYPNEKDATVFVPRLRENVRKLYEIVGIGGEDDMTMLCAVLYSACLIESINKDVKLPRDVKTPRIAERFGMNPYTVRCIYNRKIKEVVEKYREQQKRN